MWLHFQLTRHDFDILWRTARRNVEFMSDLEHNLAALDIDETFQHWEDMEHLILLAHYTCLPEGWQTLVNFARDGFKYTENRETPPPFGLYLNTYFVGGPRWSDHFYTPSMRDLDYAVVELNDENFHLPDFDASEDSEPDSSPPSSPDTSGPSTPPSSPPCPSIPDSFTLRQ